MTDNPREKLKSLMQRFVAGEDQSRQLVDRIELILRDDLEGTDLYEDLVVPVASFNPAGGEFTYEPDRLAAEFRHALHEYFGVER